MKGKEFSHERKDKMKAFRSVCEGIILIFLLIVILKALFSVSEYKPYDSSEISNTTDNGFIAVSYLGVNRNGDNKLISTERLNNHLKALKDNGYVTITQQDILDYYEKGKKLPEKSLFLLFEDGRTDTAVFSQKIIEKYNYKSTMLTYVDNFEKRNTKFLNSNNLKSLEKSTYWELGTNGHMMEDKNVFDSDLNFLGRMNFNREGYSLNTDESSIYDLTRIQPQSYWSTNHLLMRIAYDTGKEMKFVIGDESRADYFEEVCGKAEYSDNLIILTSVPQGKGKLKLLNSDDYKDINLSVELKGNILGSQSIILRSNDDQSSSISLQLVNNIVSIVQNLNGNEEKLFTKELDNSTEEFHIRDVGDRYINIEIKNDIVNLYVDDELIASNVKIDNSLNKSGAVYLESSWDEYEYSQRDIVDNVYDAVFKDLIITDMNGKLLYSNKLRRTEKAKYLVNTYFGNVINWFIKNL